MFEFIDFGIKDIIDIVLVSLLLYYAYRLMKESRSLNVFIGIIMFVIMWLIVSQILEMKLLGSIMDKLVSVGVIGLMIIFQEDIRKFLFNVGSHRRMRALRRILTLGRGDDAGHDADKKTLMPVVMACMNMSKQHVGALIVLQNDLPLGEFMRTGEEVDAKITQRLIENIFFKNSPLHDGAMIIAKGRIASAACILPISHDLDIPKEFGLRHRAAKGISKETDALAIVVSEETGNITAAYSDMLRSHISAEELETLLMKGKF